MLLYVSDNLSVDEAKAIATKLFAIAFEQEEVRLKEAYHHKNTARQ